MVDILEAIKARRLRSAKASVSFCETRDKAIHNRAEYTKECILNKNNDSVPKEARIEHDLRTLYYKMVEDYRSSSMFSMPVNYTNRSNSLWSRVAENCKKAGTTPRNYLKAQFIFFDRAFGKPPTLVQLTTTKALERAKRFDSRSTRTDKVVGTKAHRADIADLMRAGEEQMRHLMRVHGISRDEVYRKFVVTGLFTFPKEYLKADPVYRRVCEEGK